MDRLSISYFVQTVGGKKKIFASFVEENERVRILKRILSGKSVANV